MRMKRLVLASIFISVAALAAVVSRVTNFSDGQVLTAAQLNSEFNNLVNNMNALDNDNLSSSANISPVKINSVIAGDGIARNSGTGALSASVDDSTIEINSDTLRVKTAGIGATQIADGSVGTPELALNAVTTQIIRDGAVTRAKLEAVGQQLSSASGSFSTSSTSYVDVTNQTVTITTTGRPVRLALIPSSGGSASFLSCTAVSTCAVQFIRDGTDPLGDITFAVTDSSSAFPSTGFGGYDFPAAGSHTYKLQAKVQNPGSVAVSNVKLLAYEL